MPDENEVTIHLLEAHQRTPEPVEMLDRYVELFAGKKPGEVVEAVAAEPQEPVEEEPIQEETVQDEPLMVEPTVVEPTVDEPSMLDDRDGAAGGDLEVGLASNGIEMEDDDPFEKTGSTGEDDEPTAIVEAPFPEDDGDDPYGEPEAEPESEPEPEPEPELSGGTLVMGAITDEDPGEPQEQTEEAATEEQTLVMGADELDAGAEETPSEPEPETAMEPDQTLIMGAMTEEVTEDAIPDEEPEKKASGRPGRKKNKKKKRKGRAKAD